MRLVMRRPLGSLLISLVLAVFTAAQAQAQADRTGGDDPAGIIAAQIRAQGYQCDQPQSATQDMKASHADEAVWIIACESATYRVRLDPDMAAKVEKMDGGGGAAAAPATPKSE